MLGSLVVQQAEGAPVTTFMLRDNFVDNMSKRIAGRIPPGIGRLVLSFLPMLYSFGRDAKLFSALHRNL